MELDDLSRHLARKTNLNQELKEIPLPFFSIRFWCILVYQVLWINIEIFWIVCCVGKAKAQFKLWTESNYFDELRSARGFLSYNGLAFKCIERTQMFDIIDSQIRDSNSFWHKWYIAVKLVLHGKIGWNVWFCWQLIHCSSTRRDCVHLYHWIGRSHGLWWLNEACWQFLQACILLFIF